MLDKIRDFLEIKVRLKDPLDDNAAHLIPSSRIITGRTYNHMNVLQSASTLLKCQSSSGLDRAFV